MPARLSAMRRRSIDQLWIDRFQTVRPGQLIEVNLLLGHFLGLRPTAETAEVVVIDFVERERTSVGVPLLARRFLAEIELGLGKAATPAKSFSATSRPFIVARSQRIAVSLPCGLASHSGRAPATKSPWM